MNRRFLFGTLMAAALLIPAFSTTAEELNLYSSRHYDTDERLYTNFEKATGIKINRIEDNADALIARIKAEGKNSPADILVTVDAGRLWRADVFLCVFQVSLSTRIFLLHFG